MLKNHLKKLNLESDMILHFLQHRHQKIKKVEFTGYMFNRRFHFEILQERRYFELMKQDVLIV